MEVLTNIIDTISIPPIFTANERQELMETCLLMFDDAVHQDPSLFAQPTFDEVVNERVMMLLCQTLGYDTLDFNTLESLQGVLSEAYEIYGTTHDVRSFSRTMILKVPDVVEMEKHITYLKSIPQPDQRTDDWYKFRHNYLTASSIYKVFGTSRVQNELIYNKCKPLDISKYNGTVNTESPLHWGQKYEPVSSEWYEKEFKLKVSDFGCLPHRDVCYLAASPDGIVTETSSERFGRMLEIKNIVNREITGIPKKEYWIQMQLQMEVCELEECDFLETRFKEYDNYTEFAEDGTFTHTSQGKMKGAMLYFNNAGEPLYEYAPLGISEDEYQQWESTMMSKHKNLTLVRTNYWQLEEVSCILVLRNRIWFNHVKPILDNFWKTILHDREHGYEHRAPQRKLKESSGESGKKCLIDVNKLDSEGTPSTNIVFNIDTD